MSRKRARKLIHVEYIRAYHNILKYEEVIDIELDIIYQTYLNVIAKLRSEIDLTKSPEKNDILYVEELVIDKLLKVKKNVKN